MHVVDAHSVELCQKFKPFDHRQYTIREFINSQMMGVVYAAQCMCPKQYMCEKLSNSYAEEYQNI